MKTNQEYQEMIESLIENTKGLPKFLNKNHNPEIDRLFKRIIQEQIKVLKFIKVLGKLKIARLDDEVIEILKKI